MFKALISAVFIFSMLSCVSNPKSKKEIMQAKVIAFENLPFLSEELKIRLGGFSALEFLKKENDKLFFRTITDRGPNLEETKVEIDGEKITARPFLIPDYVPRIVDFSLNLKNSQLEIEKQYELKNKNGAKASGLPLANPVSEKNETAIDINNVVLENAEFGLDSEGYASYKDKHIVADEYGPSLHVFSSDFKLLQSFTADTFLPEDLKIRKINRGFEGLAVLGDYAYAMLQSPLAIDKKNVRIIKFDLQKNSTAAQFYYPIEPKIADKIGDVTFSSDGKKLFVLEQNGKIGAEQGVRQIFSVDLNLENNNPLKKELVVDLVKLGINEFEKLEGLSVVDSKTLAVVIDNDFGLDGVFDPQTSSYKVKVDPKPYLILITSTEDIF